MLDLRVVRQIDPWEEEEANLDLQDTLTPQLLHFLLDHSHELEDLAVEAGAGFVNEQFLREVLAKNPMRKLQKLRLAVTPSLGMTARLARRMVEELPALKSLNVSRWNIQSKDMRALNDLVKRNNFDLVLV